MKDNWNLKQCKEIHLKEFDADIYHWDKKVGETIEIEVSPRIMIPERSIRTKGEPRYFTTMRTSDIDTLKNKIINDIDTTIDCADTSKLEKWQIIEEVLEVIEKRFGDNRE